MERTHPAESGVGSLAGKDVILDLVACDVKANKLHLLGCGVVLSKRPAQQTLHVRMSKTCKPGKP